MWSVCVKCGGVYMCEMWRSVYVWSVRSVCVECGVYVWRV